MDLLPKTREEFKKTEYWNNFFKKRGTKSFEWYGEYTELCNDLNKYIRPADDILIIGCGNSTLSADLYDLGYTKIKNIDISPVVIKQMLHANKERREMEFKQMDATKMTYTDNQFSVVIDKGTLDALMPDDTDETVNKVRDMFEEIKRVLRIGGRYICISLLQEHILKHLLNFFEECKWIIRVIRCFDLEIVKASRGETCIPVFMIVCTKINALPTSIVECCFTQSKIERVTIDKLTSDIHSIQETALICSGLTKTTLSESEEIVMDLYTPNKSEPRYTLYILDQPPARKQNPYAAFIVPHGRETEWLFSTPEGRQKLLKSAGHDRLVIVTMHRDQEYGHLENVQRELDNNIQMLAPSKSVGKIPYLSIGDDIGRRETRFQATSEYSGDFIVEDIFNNDDVVYRRLIFLKNQSLVQSEAKLKKVGRRHRGNKEKYKVDHNYLACDHHKYMILGVELSKGLVVTAADNFNVLVIGLGGGSLCAFLQNAYDNIRITAIDIDSAMVKVAEDWFELKQNEKLDIKIDDGFQYIRNAKNKGEQFHSILFDVNNDDPSSGMSCPPAAFVEEPFLKLVQSRLCETGIFMLNLVCRDLTIRNAVVKRLINIFKFVASYKLTEDQNEIIYCSKRKIDWPIKCKMALLNLNKNCRQKNMLTDDLLDVNDFLNELKIHSK